MENINIDVKKKKKQQPLCFIVQPSLASLSGKQSHGTLFFLFFLFLLLLHPLSPLSLSSQTSCFLFPSIKPLSLQNAALSLGGRKPARHPETAGVDTFRLRVTRCCLNAHLSETSPSPLEGKTKEKRKKKLPKNQPQRNERKNPFNDSIKLRY